MNHTNDSIIRLALMKYLRNSHKSDKKVRIIEELGVKHGTGRFTIAVVNGIMHGYEIKSDKDTLQRLPRQICTFNPIFDQLTLVVGKSHLFDAFNIVPDWWGIMIAKININGSVVFNIIRKGENNKNQDGTSLARLLWREEALNILKEKGEAKGFNSKPRESIYEKLSTILDHKTLGEKVRETIFFRKDWRPDAPLMINGG